MNWKEGLVRSLIVAAMATVMFGLETVVGFETVVIVGITLILCNQIFKDAKV